MPPIKSQKKATLDGMSPSPSPSLSPLDTLTLSLPSPERYPSPSLTLTLTLTCSFILTLTFTHTFTLTFRTTHHRFSEFGTLREELMRNHLDAAVPALPPKSFA